MNGQILKDIKSQVEAAAEKLARHNVSKQYTEAPVPAEIKIIINNVKYPSYIGVLNDEEGTILKNSSNIIQCLELACLLEASLSELKDVPDNLIEKQKELLLLAAKVNSGEVLQNAITYLKTIINNIKNRNSKNTGEKCVGEFLYNNISFSDINDHLLAILNSNSKEKAEVIKKHILAWLPESEKDLDLYKEACKAIKKVANIDDTSFVKYLKDFIFSSNDYSPRYLNMLLYADPLSLYEQMKNLIGTKSKNPVFDHPEYYLADANDNTIEVMKEFYKNGEKDNSLLCLYKNFCRVINRFNKESQWNINQLVEYMAKASNKENARIILNIIKQLSHKVDSFNEAKDNKIVSNYISKIIEIVKTISTCNNPLYADILKFLVDKTIEDLPYYLSDASALDNLNEVLERINHEILADTQKFNCAKIVMEYLLSKENKEIFKNQIALLEYSTECSKDEIEKAKVVIQSYPEIKLFVYSSGLLLRLTEGKGNLNKDEIKKYAASLRYCIKHKDNHEEAEQAIESTLKMVNKDKVVPYVFILLDELTKCNCNVDESNRLINLLINSNDVKHAKVALKFIISWINGNKCNDNLYSIVSKIVGASANFKGEFKIELTDEEKEALYFSGITFSINNNDVYYADTRVEEITKLDMPEELSEIFLPDYFKNFDVPCQLSEVLNSNNVAMQNSGIQGIEAGKDTRSKAARTRIPLERMRRFKKGKTENEE